MEKRILVIDDESEFSELLQFRLRDRGYRLYNADNGMQALNQARQHLPDLILMDLLLPDLDGLSLCDILRRQPSTRNTPIIVISALSSEVTRASAKTAEACAYFTKPLDFDELEAKLEIVLAAPASHLGADNNNP
jgi:two-component system alkaline phosphatase synthesis response regulator PhoP